MQDTTWRENSVRICLADIRIHQYILLRSNGIVEMAGSETASFELADAAAVSQGHMTVPRSLITMAQGAYLSLLNDSAQHFTGGGAMMSPDQGWFNDSDRLAMADRIYFILRQLSIVFFFPRSKGFLLQ